MPDVTRRNPGRTRWWVLSLLALGLWSLQTGGCHTVIGLDTLEKGSNDDDDSSGVGGALNSVVVGVGGAVDTVTTSGEGGGVMVELCGDGEVQQHLGEQCDDGGTDDGDGCSQFCQVECEAGFLSPDNHCYLLVEVNLSWLNALDSCYMLGPGYDLAAVSSVNERNFIDDVVDVVGDVWLGGTDIQEEGMFVWTNGEPFAYNGWGPGEPNNNGGQDCIEHSSQLGDSNDTFNDETCEAQQYFLCELTPAGKPGGF